MTVASEFSDGHGMGGTEPMGKEPPPRMLMICCYRGKPAGGEAEEADGGHLTKKPGTSLGHTGTRYA